MRSLARASSALTISVYVNGESHYVDFREKAPKSATYDMFVDDPLAAQNGAGNSYSISHSLTCFALCPLLRIHE